MEPRRVGPPHRRGGRLRAASPQIFFLEVSDDIQVEADLILDRQ
jgi:hypothetical protein